MIVAFSTDDKNGLDSKISHHFGRCRYYVFVEVEGGEIKSVVSEDNPYFESHEPGMVPEFISSRKAEIIVSGGMGPRAVSFFKELGIKPVVGVSGTVKDVIKSIINGEYEAVTPETYDERRHDRHKHEW